MSKMSKFTRKNAWMVGVLAVLLVGGTVWALMIEDGSGTGRRVKVTLDNFLMTKSISEGYEAHQSHENGKSFHVETGVSVPQTLTSTATGGYHLYLRNDSTSEYLLIERLLCSTNTAGTVVAVIKNPTLGTISNHNTTTPANLNFSSGNVAQATCYTWNETGNGLGGITSGTTVATRGLAVGSSVFNLEGTYVLSTNNSIGIIVTGAAETTVGLRFFYVNKED
jgi:hypothetical protein